MKGIELVHRLMCLMSGHRPWNNTDIRVDAIFVFGRAKGEWEAGRGNEGVLQTAVDLFEKRLAPRIVIPGYAGNPDGKGGIIRSAYPGRERWKEELTYLSVPVGSVALTRGAGTNTKTEGDDFVLLARQHSWRKAVVVTQPHQMLRAMLGLVKTMEQVDYWMNVLPVCPSQIDWAAPVYGSQGKKCLLRQEHIDEEWDRIPRYQKQGDLATFKELERYLCNMLDC